MTLRGSARGGEVGGCEKDGAHAIGPWHGESAAGAFFRIGLRRDPGRIGAEGGERSGRPNGDRTSITLFKSVGAALEDLAAAELAVEATAR